ncbi:phosphatase PAP2 family protein [Micromonospora sp. WMMD812]|uniref:phosphatase PAP2 family protein n=1 Tax=Micromonospora sp. WMMD812 TaxID=3015152 RepID=UPI00248C1F67|nr:phosphatase PAP2 family protein [Micromonospora sp. WMMD812]WBB65545.1 phosphatase PAP2 family protein [Micromonospora sp. WMMD812]
MVELRATGAPGISVDWYRDIIGMAADAPQPVRWFAGHFTEGVIVLLGALLVAAALTRLRGGPRNRALALVAPVPVLLAYGCSESLKSVVDEERPCRTATEAIIAGACPPPGDWSFPSNHATIAGALAVATLLVSHRIGLVAVPVAVLAAFSRTFVGVHYPHDVAAGALLGALVVLLVTPLLARPTAEVLRRRARAAGPGPDAAGGPGRR